MSDDRNRAIIERMEREFQARYDADRAFDREIAQAELGCLLVVGALAGIVLLVLFLWP